MELVSSHLRLENNAGMGTPGRLPDLSHLVPQFDGGDHVKYFQAQLHLSVVQSLRWLALALTLGLKLQGVQPRSVLCSSHA